MVRMSGEVESLPWQLCEWSFLSLSFLISKSGMIQQRQSNLLQGQSVKDKINNLKKVRIKTFVGVMAFLMKP